MVEFWLGTFPNAGRPAELARMAERDGWDGLAFTDSQNLHGDTFAALALAASATSRLKLATGATNPATRHPAVVASAIATIQGESGGRAVLGIARGDSALSYLGRPPMPLRDFAAALRQIQTYLRGETVDCDGFSSRLEWLANATLPKVPMGVAATGPLVIGIAARVAERITFSVGADPRRLQAAIELARQGQQRQLSLGAYINAVVDPNVERARDLVRARMGTYARFSSMDRRVLESLPETDREVTQRLASAYEISKHGASAARHAVAMSDEFVDRFGIVGRSEQVAERFRALMELGLDHFVIVGHGRDTPRDVFAESTRRFAQEVIPWVKKS
jgi:5,10-methylenetetrahydromethanopterin reductase